MLTTEWGTVRYPSCRDKGRLWGRVGACCLSSLGCDLFAPRSPHWIALPPGQAPGPLIHITPPLVPTGPWDASVSMDMITRFGRQHSVGEITAESAKTARVRAQR